MAVSIGDVAKRADVSISTVSYVLNGGPRRVRPELQRKVLQAVRELDYRPSRIARSLVTRRSGALGVIHAPVHYDQRGGTFVQGVLNGIAAEAQRLRHDLLLYTNALLDPPERALNDVVDGRADGLIVVSPDRDDELIDLLAERSIPMAIVTGVARPKCPYLSSDNRVGMEEALDHLVELGHRRIGFIYGSLSFLDGKARHDAFLEGMKSRGLEIKPEWMQGGQFAPNVGYDAARCVLTSALPPTALLVGNDEMAISVIRAAGELGLRVPDDLSVVGFDGTILAQLSDPPLTTVSQPLESLGATAVRTIDSALSGQECPHLIQFPTALVIRASSGPCR